MFLKIHDFWNIVIYNIVSYRMRVGRKLWYGPQCYTYHKDYYCHLLIACKKCKFKKRKMYPQSKSKAATRLFSVIVYLPEKKCSESNPLTDIVLSKTSYYKAFTRRVIFLRLISNPKRFSSFFIFRYMLIIRLMCRTVLNLPSILSLTIL